MKDIYRCICGVEVEESGQMHEKCREEFFKKHESSPEQEEQPCPGCNGSRGAHSKFCEEYL